MARAFCIPGVIFIFCAFVLNFLTSISLPYLTALDITRTSYGNGVSQQGDGGITQLRFGVWAPCYYNEKNDKTCFSAGHGYTVQIQDSNHSNTVTISSNWTRGLAVHPVAAAVTFVALLLSLSQHITVTLVASLVAFLSATLTLIAFAIDIALFAYVKHEMDKLPEDQTKTRPGPGFWLTLVALILLLLGGCTVCFGRRRDRMGDAPSYPMKQTGTGGWFSRFRKNKV